LREPTIGTDKYHDTDGTDELVKLEKVKVETKQGTKQERNQEKEAFHPEDPEQCFPILLGSALSHVALTSRSLFSVLLA